MTCEQEHRPLRIADVLADPTHEAHDFVADLIKQLETGQASLCSCIGKVGDDPYCPCEMKRRGLEPTNPWTPEKVAEFERVMKQITEER